MAWWFLMNSKKNPWNLVDDLDSYVAEHNLMDHDLGWQLLSERDVRPTQQTSPEALGPVDQILGQMIPGAMIILVAMIIFHAIYDDHKSYDRLSWIINNLYIPGQSLLRRFADLDWGSGYNWHNCTAKAHSIPLGGCSKGFLTNLREFPAIHWVLWIQPTQTANMGTSSNAGIWGWLKYQWFSHVGGHLQFPSKKWIENQSTLGWMIRPLFPDSWKLGNTHRDPKAQKNGFLAAINHLVGGLNPSEKYESQLGWWTSQ